MNERYEPKSIEPRWQKRWDDAGVFRAGRRPGAEKRYVLEMFPYPSGAMHMGHARVYTIGDALARYLRMRGYDVLHPMGFDALGLPAENAALKDGRHPAERTRENIDAFRREMKRVGFSFDWEREFATCDPEYYRWNQWFFLKMLERDIVYRRTGQGELVHRLHDRPRQRAGWSTGNLCERCSSPVLEKVIPEWAFRITAYADDLLAGLEELRDWPERVTTMQRNWIGRSEGAEVDLRGGRVRGDDPRLHHAHRHHLRLHLRGARPRAPARRGAHRARPAGPRSTRLSRGCATPRRRSEPARGRPRRAYSPGPTR